jgi:hypothetical protein
MATKGKVDPFTNYHVREGRAVSIYTDSGTVTGIVKERINDQVIVNCMGVDRKFTLNEVTAVWNKYTIDALIGWAHGELKRQHGINAPTSHEIQEFIDRHEPTLRE